MDAVQELRRELERETDADERANILRTIAELESPEPLALPDPASDPWQINEP
jgi:hypothetical protein